MKNNTLKYIIPGLIILAAASVLICWIADKTSTDQQYRNLFSQQYRIFSPPTPSKAEFAGEAAPLNLFYVREALDREILAATYMHASTILMFKRANRWFPLIEPLLKAEGVPDDFKYLALAESNLSNVVSPSGAEGFWQFIKPTGQKYGLEITEEVDERYNLEKATIAACEYFKEAREKYGNWTLAAASYNRGLDGISDALQHQRVNSFYDLYLNDETGRYIYRILALKEVYLHPVKYGFYLKQSDFYPSVPTYQVRVDSAIQDLPSFALQQKVTYKVLRDFNPWIRRYNLPNKTRKVYVFVLPKPGMILTDSVYRNIPSSGRFFNDTLKIQQIQ